LKKIISRLEDGRGISTGCRWGICLSAGKLIGGQMKEVLRKMWHDDEGQDIAEYAVMLAVILVIVVGTIRLIGSNANNVFSSVASSIK
jgi:Flp pilus assembly pilin Flp